VGDELLSDIHIEGTLSDGALLRASLTNVSSVGVGLSLDSQEQLAIGPLRPGDRIRDARLYCQGRIAYRGDARVAHASRSASGRIVIGLEVADGVVDLSMIHGLRRLPRKERAVDAAAYVSDWESTSFPAWLADRASELRGLRDELRAFESEAASMDLERRVVYCGELLARESEPALEWMAALRAHLTTWDALLPRHQRDRHRALTRERLLDLLCECPFVERAFRKPLGYAGDYELMNMLYRSEPEGASLFGRLVNFCGKQDPAATATRNRLELLATALASAIDSHTSPHTRILNVGCGAAKEIRLLLSRRPDLGRRIELTLVDQDPRAMEHCEVTLGPLARATGMKVTFICDPISRLLQATDLKRSMGTQDVIYSAGMFDYLTDDVFCKLVTCLWGALSPTGQLIIGNMGAHNPSIAFMEYVMDWFLIHRTRQELIALSHSAVPEPQVNRSVACEALGLNLFLRLSRA
jgi:extracellular factor (EF) 3-hydroxypalmitic acid methyl ester biosynthesis protein